MNVANLLAFKGRDVITSTPEASIHEVAKVLSKHRIGSLVIVDESDKIAGIISERDIVRAVASDGIKVLEQPVGNIMIKKVVTCQQGDTVNYVMTTMSEGRIRHLPVIKGGKLAGLISIGDVVKSRIAEVEQEAEAMRHYIAG